MWVVMKRLIRGKQCSTLNDLFSRTAEEVDTTSLIRKEEACTTLTIRNMRCICGVCSSIRLPFFLSPKFSVSYVVFAVSSKQEYDLQHSKSLLLWIRCWNLQLHSRKAIYDAAGLKPVVLTLDIFRKYSKSGRLQFDSYSSTYYTEKLVS